MCLLIWQEDSQCVYCQWYLTGQETKFCIFMNWEHCYIFLLNKILQFSIFCNSLHAQKAKSKSGGSKPFWCISHSVGESWQPCHVQPIGGKFSFSLSLCESLGYSTSLMKHWLSKVALEGIHNMQCTVSTK